MESIVRLLLFALSEWRPTERMSAGASRFTTAAIFSAAAVTAVCAACVCLIAAGWIALVPIIGAAAAALCAALGLAVIALVLWLVARANFAEDVPYRHPASQPSPLAELLGEGPGPELKRLWSGNKVPLLLAALVAGMVVASSSARPPTRD